MLKHSKSVNLVHNIASQCAVSVLKINLI